MFLKVENKFLNVLGADTVTRLDGKNDSRFLLRWGQTVETVIVYPTDKPGSPRRELFEALERFLDTMTIQALCGKTNDKAGSV
jgi:hypothetical protein